jgi:hypothetical protein
MQLDLFTEPQIARSPTPAHCANCDPVREASLLRGIRPMRDEAIRNGLEYLANVDPAAECEPGESVADVRRHFAYRLQLFRREAERRWPVK